MSPGGEPAALGSGIPGSGAGRVAAAGGPGRGGGDAPLLVVNADDFGLTPGVSRAVVAAHRQGVVTSTSVLAVAPMWPATARWLDEVPALGVGLHACLVGEDPPLLGAAEIPTLVDRRGRFASSWRVLVPRLAAGRVDPADVARELDAQAQAVVEALPGRRLTHVDSHQHVHLWPSVTEVVLDVARRYGIPAVRVPDASGRGPASAGVRRLAGGLRRKVAAAGLATTDGFRGLDTSGHLDRTAFVAQVDRRPGPGGAPGPSSVELGCHPGTAVDPDRARYRWGFRWADELDAVGSSWAREVVASAGWRLATYADVAAAGAVAGGPGTAAPAAGAGGGADGGR